MNDFNFLLINMHTLPGKYLRNFKISNISNLNKCKQNSKSVFNHSRKIKQKQEPVLIVFKLSWWMNFNVGFMFLVYFGFWFFRHPKQTLFICHAHLKYTQLICIYYFICWRQRSYKKFRYNQTVWHIRLTHSFVMPFN